MPTSSKPSRPRRPPPPEVPLPPRHRGVALPEDLRREAEQLFGANFSGVRVYAWPRAARTRARALTSGNRIFFAPNCYAPDTAEGVRLIGHELAHVVQQRSGRARNRLGYGVAVVRDEGLEAEAERMGALLAARVHGQAGRSVQRMQIGDPPSEWKNTYSTSVGFKFGALKAAARKQHTRETCWAAALAAGSALLGVKKWDNEIKWYKTAKDADLVMETSTRILPENLVKLVNGIIGFKAQLYSMMGLITIIQATLKMKHVILLMAEEHVVILGQLQLDNQTGALTYHVIEPATGDAESWSQEKFLAFKPECAAIMRRA